MLLHFFRLCDYLDMIDYVSGRLTYAFIGTDDLLRSHDRSHANFMRKEVLEANFFASLRASNAAVYKIITRRK